MLPSDTSTDQQLLSRLRAGESLALDALFRRYYTDLCQVALRYVRDEAQAEDIIQELFVNVWEKRAKLPEDLTSAAGYLRRAARNRSLNFLRDQNRIPVDEGEIPETIPSQDMASDGLEQDDLKNRIHRAIDRLPERCRLVFTMSKLDDMSNREIADSLEISPKTVENQMTRAYKFLREWLAVIILIITLVNAGNLLSGRIKSPQTLSPVCQTTNEVQKTTSVLGGVPNFGVSPMKAFLSFKLK